MRALIGGIALALALLGPAASAELLREPTSTPWRHSFEPAPVVGPTDELLVSGENGSQATITLVVRIDDAASHDYASRLNIERVLPPGPFLLRVPLAGAAIPSGRKLDIGSLRRAMVFTGEADPALSLERIAIESGHVLPAGALGFDLGPAGAPVFPGFASILPDDPRLTGRTAAVARPGGDALIADGIAGIEHLRLDVPPGLVRITLWTEDLGDWERLPEVLERRVRINGVTVLEERMDAPTWLRQRYVAGRVEHGPKTGAWDAFGRRRGGRFSRSVEVGDDGVVIELAGRGAAATFLSGVLVEAAGVDALASLEAARGERFDETWRIDASAPRPPVSVLRLRASGSTRLVAAPGTTVMLELEARAPREIAAATLSVEGPARGGTVLPVELRHGLWRLRRPNTGATRLVLDDVDLVAESSSSLPGDLPRRWVIRIVVSPSAPPGTYAGTATLRVGGAALAVPFTVEVLAVALPEAPWPIGVYLDDLPPRIWVAPLQATRQAARACDLRALQQLGLTGVAPALSNPTDAASRAAFVAELRAVQGAGFELAAFAYAPLKRLAQGRSPAAFRGALEALAADIAAAGLPQAVWAVADEPSNPGSQAVDLAADSRSAMPNAKLAAQLNHPDDRDRVAGLDVALVNPGFGLEAGALASLARRGVEPWLYNMPEPRLAAGFWLWRSGARGYLQWHARMPSADPFDPTDGREADVQLLGPSAEPCPAMPDVHRDLLALADGIVDLRWLLWLDRMAPSQPRAAALRQTLHAEIPGAWRDARAAADRADGWRKRIVDLARGLQCACWSQRGECVAGGPACSTSPGTTAQR